jgi:hypothetical protein
MKKIAYVLMFLLVMSFATGAQAFTVTTYNNYVSWLSAVNFNTVTENFQDATFEPGFSITEVGGAGVIHYGVYENIADQQPLRYQVYNYAPGMYAFGSWLDLANPGGAGSAIDMVVNDNNTFVMTIPNTAAGQFFGFVADSTFYGVRFQDNGNNAGVQETYFNVDTSVAPAAVPIPPAIFLLGSGLLGLGFVRRRNNK